jgi:hypothetical protein
MPDVTHLFLKIAHGKPMLPVRQVHAQAGQGLEGDVSFGRSTRQLLLVDSDVLARFDLPPGTLRENLVVRGLPLAAIPPGALLRAGETVLEATGECEPCGLLDQYRPGLRESIRGQRGLLARIRTGGQIRIGDSVEIVVPGPATGA